MGKRILNHLPAEITDEILYKLPVKSLLRFKCVSKSWRSTISSRRFIKEHLNNSNSGTDFSHHNLLFRFPHQSKRVIPESDYLPVERFINPKSVGSCCIGSLLSENDDDYEPINPNFLGPNQSIPIPAFEDSRQIYFLGSCNGLILITVNVHELYLWNPSTRKAKNIINASFRQETGHASFAPDSTCGFGYNEMTDDYKVVCPFSGLIMYSSRTDSWKKIRNFKEEGSTVDGPAKFVNGRLHWLLSEKDGVRRNIVSLDLGEENKYQIIAPPPHCGYSDYGHRLDPVLKELGGYLSFICYHDPPPVFTLDVWVMKKESWSKIRTFPYQHGYFPTPIWLKKNGDIVLTYVSNLVVYRGEDKLRHSRVDNMIDSESIVYIESLAAPISDDKQPRR